MITALEAKRLAADFALTKYGQDDACAKFMKDVSETVKRTANAGEYSLVLTIPEYICSSENPRFDKIRYCCRELENLGYDTCIHDRNIAISWE